ncbi:Brix-domain-containing protein [Polyplosphaeria fusca]|uniref:Ribosome production factor 2 homolog n=1 Tax=Polyplosphaeria fusca TaxID=682080 RepID=A0A9P4QTY6_9PLEO|nr:Brix-domain-containing protein [Polyplosphaeria fusca]
MLKQAKPKNARAKREMDKRAPREHENPKTTLFVKGEKTSMTTKLAANDLARLKKPFAEKFNKKNAIKPFEDASSLEFFSLKNDASILAFSTHQKKRPHCLTLARTFDHKLLDMLELYIDPEKFIRMETWKNKKPALGMKPMISFHGSLFESPTQTKYTLVKSLFIDFFRGQEATELDLAGLQYIISISVSEEEEGRPPPPVHLRVFSIVTMKSGQKLPRIELEEIGPRIDFTLGREKFADDDMWKQATRKPKGTEPKTKKNIDMDIMGDKVGKLHVPKQDLSQLQTRKMKGLKRGRNENDEVEEAEDDDEDEMESDIANGEFDSDDSEEPPTPKKARVEE